MSNTLIIIPTYNESENIEAIVEQSLSALPAADILVVDDASPDGTGKMAAAMAAQESRVHVLHRPGKAGLGRAYLAGFEFALHRGYEFVVQMDADFSHDPKYLPTLVRSAESAADLVVGSRYIAGGGTENWGLVRKFISRSGGIYARSLLGMAVHDPTAGFVCYRRALLKALPLHLVRTEGYGFQIEMKFRSQKAGFRIIEVPIVFADRRVGESKMSAPIALEALRVVWRLRREV